MGGSSGRPTPPEQEIIVNTIINALGRFIMAFERFLEGR